MKFRCLFFCLICFLFGVSTPIFSKSTPSTQRKEKEEKTEKSFVQQLEFPLSVSYVLGSLENEGMGLEARLMNAVAFQIMPSYRFSNSWSAGVSFDYRYQGQLASLSSGGGTNLKGYGFLLGIGAIYSATPNLKFAGNFDFLGRYFFIKQTRPGEDDYLSNPLGCRLKMQYLPFEFAPISIDLDLQYIRWATFTVTDTDHGKSSNQYNAGLGMTYHFGNERTSNAK